MPKKSTRKSRGSRKGKAKVSCNAIVRVSSEEKAERVKELREIAIQEGLRNARQTYNRNALMDQIYEQAKKNNSKFQHQDRTTTGRWLNLGIAFIGDDMKEAKELYDEMSTGGRGSGLVYDVVEKLRFSQLNGMAKIFCMRAMDMKHRYRMVLSQLLRKKIPKEMPDFDVNIELPANCSNKDNVTKWVGSEAQELITDSRRVEAQISKFVAQNSLPSEILSKGELRACLNPTSGKTIVSQHGAAGLFGLLYRDRPGPSSKRVPEFKLDAIAPLIANAISMHYPGRCEKALDTSIVVESDNEEEAEKGHVPVAEGRDNDSDGEKSGSGGSEEELVEEETLDEEIEDGEVIEGQAQDGSDSSSSEGSDDNDDDPEYEYEGSQKEKVVATINLTSDSDGTDDQSILVLREKDSPARAKGVKRSRVLSKSPPREGPSQPPRGRSNTTAQRAPTNIASASSASQRKRVRSTTSGITASASQRKRARSSTPAKRRAASRGSRVRGAGSGAGRGRGRASTPSRAKKVNRNTDRRDSSVIREETFALQPTLDRNGILPKPTNPFAIPSDMARRSPSPQRPGETVLPSGSVHFPGDGEFSVQQGPPLQPAPELDGEREPNNDVLGGFIRTLENRSPALRAPAIGQSEAGVDSEDGLLNQPFADDDFTPGELRTNHEDSVFRSPPINTRRDDAANGDGFPERMELSTPASAVGLAMKKHRDSVTTMVENGICVAHHLPRTDDHMSVEEMEEEALPPAISPDSHARKLSTKLANRVKKMVNEYATGCLQAEADERRRNIPELWETGDVDNYQLAKSMLFQRKRQELELKGFTMFPGILSTSVTSPNFDIQDVFKSVDRNFNENPVLMDRAKEKRREKDPKALWVTIYNQGEGDVERSVVVDRRRFMTWGHKLIDGLDDDCKRKKTMIDILLGNVVRSMYPPELEKDENMTHFAFPDYGSIFLRTCLDTPRQGYHCDFPPLEPGDELPSHEAPPVHDIFMMYTGAQPFAIRVWPTSHTALNVGSIEEPAGCSEDEKKELAKQREQLQEDYENIAKHLPSKLVIVPPFSVFVGRGDLVHAGASGEELLIAFSKYKGLTAADAALGKDVFVESGGIISNTRGHIVATRGYYTFDGLFRTSLDTPMRVIDHNMPKESRSSS